MNISAAYDYVPCGDGHNASSFAEFAHYLKSPSVAFFVFSSELGQKDIVIAEIKINIACGKPLAYLTDVLALLKFITLKIRGFDPHRYIRDRKLVNPKSCCLKDLEVRQ